MGLLTHWCAKTSRAGRPRCDALHVWDGAQRRWHRSPRRCRVIGTACVLTTCIRCATLRTARVKPLNLPLEVQHLSRLQATPSARTATTACASSSRFGAFCSSCRSFRPAGRVPVRSRSACMLMQGNSCSVSYNYSTKKITMLKFKRGPCDAIFGIASLQSRNAHTLNLG